MCSSFGLEYLSFHFWVGIWLAAIISLFVALEGSVLVRYVSRFTQDIFALLISLIFIFESFKKMYMVILRTIYIDLDFSLLSLSLSLFDVLFFRELLFPCYSQGYLTGVYKLHFKIKVDLFWILSRSWKFMYPSSSQFVERTGVTFLGVIVSVSPFLFVSLFVLDKHLYTFSVR